MSVSAKKKRAKVVALNVPVGVRRDRIGAIIRGLRKEAGLTLRALEAKSGVANSEISRLESGIQDCRLLSFIKIAAALGLPACPVIDLALFVDAMSYEPAICANPRFKEMVKALKLQGDIPSFYVAVVAAFAAQLLISSKPTAVVIDMAYPTEDLREAFERFANSVESGMKAQDRLALLLKLRENPLDALIEKKLMSLSLLDDVYHSMDSRLSTNPTHWIQLMRLGNEPLAQCSTQVEMESSAGNVLTEAETKPKVTDEVKLQLPPLLDRLKKATARSGKKSELAEFLAKATKSKVPLASVSRWLSGEREPGGEVALQLRQWVEQQEGQVK